jgi:cleavage and polyadenylation specificity factor subunit 3
MSDEMEIIPLGAGCEVGRSCVVMRFKGSTVMFDCGVHPAFNGLAALPYFDEFELSEVDLLLVTHFHLDHCGALPYFTEKTNFNGRVFMTHATKAIYKILLNDYVRVTSAEEKLYDEQDLMRSMDKIELIDYHQVVQHKGIRFTALNAGHVLGAAMFNVEIAGVRCLYTGDFSCEEDRHLKGAEQPTDNPHVLIVESTYGVQRHGPADVREARFSSFVHKVVARGGRCLIPVFALGRAQELLLILGRQGRSARAERGRIRGRTCATPSPSSPAAHPLRSPAVGTRVRACAARCVYACAVCARVRRGQTSIGGCTPSCTRCRSTTRPRSRRSA